MLSRVGPLKMTPGQSEIYYVHWMNWLTKLGVTAAALKRKLGG